MTEEKMEKNIVTAVPSLEEKLAELSGLLKTEGRLALVSIDIQSLLELQEAFDKSMYDTVLYAVRSCFDGLRDTEIRKEDLIVSNITNGKKFYVFLSKAREKQASTVEDLEKIAFRIQEYIYHRLFRIFYSLTAQGPRVCVGYGLAFHSAHLNEKSVIQNLMEEAELAASYLAFKTGLIRKALVHDLLLYRNLDVRFQPLIRLADRAVIGYQARVAGPAGTVTGGGNLEHYARDTGYGREFEETCRALIFASVRNLGNDKLLFMPFPSEPALPETRDRSDRPEGSGLAPERIVFEIDDRRLLEDGARVTETLERFPGALLLAGVDWTWTEKEFGLLDDERIRYVRAGSDIVRELGVRKAADDFFRALVRSARRRGQLLIAAGVAAREQLEALLGFGPDIAEGVFFSTPAPGFTGDPLSTEFFEDRVLQNKLLLSIYLKRGRDYLSRADYDKAVLEFSKVIEIDPANREAWFCRGFSFCEEAVYSIAVKDLMKLKEIDPDYLGNWLLEARIAERKGDAEKAVSFYHEYIARAADSFDADVVFARARLDALEGGS